MVLRSLECAVLGALLAAEDPVERTAAKVAHRVAESPRTVERALRMLESRSPPLAQRNPDPELEIVGWSVTDAGRTAHERDCW